MRKIGLAVCLALMLACLCFAASADYGTISVMFYFDKNTVEEGDSLTANWTITGARAPYEALWVNIYGTASDGSQILLASSTEYSYLTSLIAPNVQGEEVYVSLWITDADGRSGQFISQSIPVQANRISIQGATMTVSNRRYTGSPLEPAPTVTLQVTSQNEWTTVEKILEQGTDYTVAYTDNINAGTATVTVIGMGEYTGAATANFTIHPKSLADGAVACPTRAYTGSAVTPTPTVVVDGIPLVRGTDFSVRYTNNIERGTATAKIVGKGNYSGTVSTTFQIVARALTADFVKAANRTYTGSAVASKVTVTAYDKTLVNGTDYTVTFSDNIDAGYATATITGMGNYKGTVTKTYQILPKSLENAVVTADNRMYTGKARQSAPTVVLDGKKLANGTDYTVSYLNNVNAGTATVAVSGTGNYKGTAYGTYTIHPLNLSEAAVTIPNRAYTGSAIASAPTVKMNGITLSSGVDYTVAYENNVNVGTATATITGKGNYKGTTTATFKIAARTLQADYVTARNRTYTGKAVNSNVTVTFNGRTLVKGTDYTVSFSNNVSIGTAYATVRGIGNYKGTVTREYQVLPISLSSAVVNVVNRRYTGSALTPAPTVILDEKTLVSGTDYTVRYANNLHAGTATVTVTGKGIYSGTVTGTFKIIRCNISNAGITASNRRYTGRPVKSSLNVVFNGVKLAEGTDYVTQYSNNVDIGTATVVIIGIGDFGGSVTMQYQIKE